MAKRLISVDDDNNLPPEVQSQLVGQVEDHFSALTSAAEAAAGVASVSAAAASTDAAAAETSREAAEAAAATATAPTDEMFDALVGDTASLTRISLDDLYATTNGERPVGKNELTINVADYGAVGDYNGTTGTDNIAAFNAAFAAVKNGGRVWVPPGRYFMNDTLVWPENKAFRFECGAGGNLGSPAGYGTQLVFAAGRTGISVVGAPLGWTIGPFAITSLSTVAGTDHGIFTSSGRGLVEGTTIERFGGHGLFSRAGTAFGGGNANNNVFRRIRSYGNRGAGIRIEGSDTNKTSIEKPDVVANFGWGIELVSSSMCDVTGAHADQQYNGSPGAYRDAGNSNNWDWLYVEGGSVFLIDTGSSNGRLASSVYGAPTVQYTGSAHLTWRISVAGGSWFTRYVEAAGTQKYKIGAGGVAINSFDILNETSSQRILSVDANNTRAQWFQNQIPNADNTHSLGSASARWANGFFSSYVRVGSFTTALRPSAATAGIGSMVYDSTLGKPVWSTGSQWRDAAGAVV